ncbi:Transmembrane amino acid transporter [Pleurostoma richardsiae]|uniref:Transmembrane amino acid transporter n=1 Tax=Pleurostoma richardsiae TaxID=41990 RepID=A0AA38VTU6_9PEZI|nr:Transmembrane amino acid transporter [Pleurostoma richardsiae]
MPSRNPSTWDEYDARQSPQRTGSVSSAGVQFEDDSPAGRTPDDASGRWPDAEWSNMLRRRRSSVTNRLAAITDIGGVNSIRSFTRSWQRAAGFPEVIPQRPSFVFAPDQEPVLAPAPDAIQYGRGDIDVGHEARRSLLRERLEASPAEPEGRDESDSMAGSPRAGGSDHQPLLQRQDSPDINDRERKALGSELTHAFTSGSMTSNSIFSIPPHLVTPSPIIGSFGSYRSYGTVTSDVSERSMAQAGTLWRQQQETGANVPDGEVQPILVKEVEQDGKIVLTVEGQSTLPQTIFNSINVLIGVGLLSLPMGLRYAGWLCGMTILLMAALTTAYTARLLAKCMDLDPSLITFSDLAYISFGRNARIATSILFTLELVAACVALIVLFADSLTLLFPGTMTLTEWKVVCSLILTPLNFLPLRFLSFTSVIGIFSCFSIVLIVVIDGILKTQGPGSLVDPAKTYLFPANWLTLPLSFGLLMSPWGGHSVFPNIYRDMRHPYKYPSALKTTFSFTYLLDATTAVAGILMFGDDVMDAVTSNILSTAGYPRVLTFLMCAFIAIVPLTKIPLNARPIISTVDVLLGLHQQAVADSSSMVGRSMYFRGIMKIAIRVATVLVFLIISIVFPAFDSIMAFMGSALCFTICVILPLAFYLKLFAHEISAKEKAIAYVAIAICSLLSVMGTVWAFLPKSLIRADE